MIITTPLGAVFVAADEPLPAFSSASDAEQYLEAVDVEGGIYSAAYGPNGEPYSIATNDGLVFVERTGKPAKPDELRRLFVGYLVAVGSLYDESASFDEFGAKVWALACSGSHVC